MDRPMRTLTMLNELGDVEIAWDSDQDDAMRDIIARKMAEGVKFFIVKPMIGGWLHRRVRMNSIHDLDKNRISIKDEDIEKMFVAGNIALFRRDSGERIDTERLARTPEEAASTSTVAVRQFQGG